MISHVTSPKSIVITPLSDPTAATTMPSATTTNEFSSSSIHSENNKEPESRSPENVENVKENSKNSKNIEENSNNNADSNVVVRRERPSRACTQRAVQRMQQAAAAEAALAAAEKKRKAARRRERVSRLLKEEEVEEEERSRDEEEDGDEKGGEEEEDAGPSSSSRQQYSKVITPLVGVPEASQLPRWNIRSMWQLASILNFFNVFRPLLNIKVELSAEEFETALIMPNNTLGEIHMPLLKAIPPITRIALGQNTWITVLCRKLRDWWHWVAEGELPIVASHGAEIDAYNALDPGVRVVIMKALCDIRVEQEDIRNFIDDSIKHGIQLSTFRKERVGGDSHGISYWYEDDPVFGHRLYREIRNVEVKRGKGKNLPPIANSSYQWETVATNLDEFHDVSEKLSSSKNRTEGSVGKKLKKDMLPEIEKVHKRKERLLKKQHRQALLLDNMMNVDGLAAGRSLRDRKRVTYTFDDYDRSINEAIKETKKKPSSPDPTDRRDFMRHENVTNGRRAGPSQYTRQSSFSRQSPRSSDYDEYGDNHNVDTLDRSNRQRQRPQRYSVEDFVDAVSDNEADFDSDEDIVGEVVYDEEYLRQKKRRKTSSSSEGDEEYHWDDENPEDEEEEEEENNSSSTSDRSDQRRKFEQFPGRTRRETKLRSVDEIQSGLRRSKRATRNRMNFSYYDLSESETELMKPEKSNGANEQSNASGNTYLSRESQDSDGNPEDLEMKVDQPVGEHLEEHPEMPKEEQEHLLEKSNGPGDHEVGVRTRRFLDLNQLAPGSGFDDAPNSMKDEDTDDF